MLETMTLTTVLANSPRLSATVGQLVAEEPDRAPVFEAWGIDYCCGGQRSLADSCEAKGVDPEVVWRDLMRCDEAAALRKESEDGEPDWNATTFTALCDHIEQTHHAYLRKVLPGLVRLTTKVAEAHGANDGRLVELRDVFAEFRTEIEAHTDREELILFPLCRLLDKRGAVDSSIAASIHRMEAEHDDVGSALARMRALTDGYTVPPTACATYRELLRVLAELESDMHRHVHKENHILFPRALAKATGERNPR